MGALYKGFFATAILSAISLWFVTDWIIGLNQEFLVNQNSFLGKDLFYCGFIGLIVTSLLILITEYYTGTNYRPVQSIAKASKTGHGTNVIQGLAISLEATALPAIVICIGIISTVFFRPYLYLTHMDGNSTTSFTSIERTVTKSIECFVESNINIYLFDVNRLIRLHGYKNLFDETLVVVVSEMTRTPKVNCAREITRLAPADGAIRRPKAC